jgi:hypothetical protein
LHLVRPSGEPRNTIAEIAFALHKEWEQSEITDIAVSKAYALGRRLMYGLGGLFAPATHRRSTSKRRST